MKFNEDSRVKIPAILHLTRLGYGYLSLKSIEWNEENNIVPSLFQAALSKLNPQATQAEINDCLNELDLLLDNEDLGKAFYQRITTQSGLRIIDFEDFQRNSLHVVTEFPCKHGEEEFRPDVTLLINGLPLVFIEVKKPNNSDGILAERKRIESRFKNPKFRKFINATQLMVFSNNMDYDDGSPEPLVGAFYAAPSYDKPRFNYFREEHPRDLATLLAPENPALEALVLKDNNLTPQGMADFVVANRPAPAESFNQSGEGEIRRALYEADLVDTAMRDSVFTKSGVIPQVASIEGQYGRSFGQLFYSTQISDCLWFFAKVNPSLKLEPGSRTLAA